MHRSLVLKSTRYIFLAMTLLSAAASALLFGHLGGRETPEAIVKRIVSMAVGEGMRISGAEHPFIPFGLVVFNDVEIEADGIKATVGTVEADSSIFSVLRFFAFGKGKLNLAVRNADLSISPPRSGASAPDRAGSFSDSVDKILGARFRLDAEGITILYDDGIRNGGVEDLAILLDLEKDLDLRHVHLFCAQARWSDAENALEASADAITMTGDSISMSDLRLESRFANLKRDSLSAEWFLDDGLRVILPETQFEAFGFPIRLSGLDAKLEEIGGNEPSLFVFTSGLECSLSNRSKLNLVDVAFTARLMNGYGGARMRLESDMGLDLSGKTVFNAPVTLNASADEGLSINSVLLSSPFLRAPCRLESKLAGDLLEARIRPVSSTAEESYLSLDVSLDLGARMLDAALVVPFSYVNVPPVVSAVVSASSPASLAFHSDLENSDTSLRLDWKASVFGMDLSADLAARYVQDSLAFSGRGISVGNMTISLPSELDLKHRDDGIVFPVFWSQTRIADVNVSEQDGCMFFGIGTESGKFSLSGSFDPKSPDKTARISILALKDRYDLACRFLKDGFDLSSDRFQMGLKVSDGVSAYIRAVDLIVPDFTAPSFARAGSDGVVWDGAGAQYPDHALVNIDFAFSSDAKSRTLAMRDSSFSIVLPKSSVGWTIDYAQEKINLRNFLYASSELSISGGGWLKGDFFSRDVLKTLEGDFTFQSSDGGMMAQASASKSSLSGATSGFSARFRMDRPPAFTRMRKFALDCSFLTDWLGNWSADGSFKFVPASGRDEAVVSIESENGEIFLHCDELCLGRLSITGMDMIASLDRGEADFSCAVSLEYPRLDETIRINFNPSVHARLRDWDGGFSPSSLSKAVKDASLLISGISMDHERFDDLAAVASIDGSVITVKDGFARGRADLESGEFSFRLNAPFPAQGDFDGLFADGKLSLRCELEHLPLSLSRHFVYRPIFRITSGDLRGKLVLSGNLDDLSAHCFLVSDEMEIWNFWTRNEFITIHNLNIVGSGKDVKLLRTTATSVNKSTSKVSFFEAEAGLSLDNAREPLWNVNVYVPETEAVEANIPVPYADYNISVKKANGTFLLTGIGMDRIGVAGDVFGADALFSKPMEAPSYVFGSRDGGADGEMSLSIPNTEISLKVRTGENVRMTYPDPADPIVDATLKSGLDATILYSDRSGGAFGIDGKLEIESGYARFLSRKFKIENGDITWKGAGSSAASPVINLRASYRDFDKASGRIDLYVNLTNATLDNLNPTFTSSGGLSENEIMMRLGQAVAQMGSAQESARYLTSLSITAFDLFTTFSQTARFTSFISFPDDMGMGVGLDTFALQTNFLPNFLTDAAPMMFRERARSGGSAFSRYIDGTSLSIEKRLSQSLAVSFSAEMIGASDSDIIKNKGIGIGSDLSCLMTFSVDWDPGPFGFAFFTRPEDFSIPGFLSGFGMHISKSIRF